MYPANAHANLQMESSFGKMQKNGWIHKDIPSMMTWTLLLLHPEPRVILLRQLKHIHMVYLIPEGLLLSQLRMMYVVLSSYDNRTYH